MSATDDVRTTAALLKLARALDVEPAEVEFLRDLPVETLQSLKWRAIDIVTKRTRARLQRVATASKLTPIPVAASLGEKWFGPVLGAQMVGLVDPSMGVKFAKHMSMDFVADVSARIDPRIMGELAERYPIDIMKEIARTLSLREDYLTLSLFTGHMSPGIIADLLASIDDPAVSVRIAPFVDDPADLDPIVAEFSDAYLVDLQQGIVDDELFDDARYVAGHLSDTQLARLATAATTADVAEHFDWLI